MYDARQSMATHFMPHAGQLTENERLVTVLFSDSEPDELVDVHKLIGRWEHAFQL